MVGAPLLRHTAVQQHRRHRIRKYYQIRLKQSHFTTMAPRYYKIKLRGQCNRMSFRPPKRHRWRIGYEFNSSFNQPTMLEFVHGGG
jgi:predicted transcriptional regulator